jgi:DNA polymerase-3 subunit beta
MKFSVSSSELLKHLQVGSGAIGSNPVLPILEDFLFQINDGALKITSTDLETSICTSLDVMSDEDGAIAIPAKILLDTLKALPEQPITFDVELETNAIELTSAYGKYKLAGNNADDFPKIPSPDQVDKIAVPAEVIGDAINKTLFATSNDELRLAMTGVRIEVDFSKLKFVATDAHKLVRYSYDDIKSEVGTSFIIPKKAFSLLKQALPSEGEVKLSFNKSNAFFDFNDNSLICRLIDASYPDYDGVIPKDNNNVMTVARNEFLNSLKRIVIYANKTTNQVVLSINNGSLNISAQDLDFSNEATEQMPCQYDGDPIIIGFNAKFLIEMLNVLEADEVKFEMSTPNRAGLLIPSEQDEHTDLLMLVMPVMLNQ